jgi:poly(ADP-ribose) glycohydrolase ARH3
MKIDKKDRFIGSLLGTAVGDILGASVEGMSRGEILREYGEVRDFLPTPRGFGCYTDDSQMTIALAVSIIKNKGLDPQDCARTYAQFWESGRGYGWAAALALEAIRKGVDYRKTGTLLFKDGSYGNGGAMRIAPVGLVYHSLNNSDLEKKVYDAIVCTHVHPEGVDGAVVQAKAIAILVNTIDCATFNPFIFLNQLAGISKTNTIKEKLHFIIEVLKRDRSDKEAVAVLGNGIRASEAVSSAILATVKYYKNPEEAVVKSVNFGGDTDTIGAMTGAQMGALHGTGWIPDRWFNNMENGEKGKDYFIYIGAALSQL